MRTMHVSIVYDGDTPDDHYEFRVPADEDVGVDFLEGGVLKIAGTDRDGDPLVLVVGLKDRHVTWYVSENR